MKLLIEGEDYSSNIIQTLVKDECAFSLFYKGNQEIVVGFSKGDWTMCRIKNGNPVGFIQMNDCPEVVECDDSMAKALLETLIQNTQEESSDKENWTFRVVPSRVLDKFFGFWSGGATLERVLIHQTERNSIIESTGEIVLSPSNAVIV